MPDQFPVFRHVRVLLLGPSSKHLEQEYVATESKVVASKFTPPFGPGLGGSPQSTTE